jgi:hypothetical protein
MPNYLRSPRFLVAAGILMFLSSSANAAEPAACVPDLSGRWSGCWQSGTKGHHGPLHATFHKLDDCHYHVRFHGRFWGVFPFAYGITLNVVGQDGDRVLLSGTKHVPGFGVFETSACASSCEFTATFTSRNDHGKFKLSRK